MVMIGVNLETEQKQALQSRKKVIHMHELKFTFFLFFLLFWGGIGGFFCLF